MTIRNTATDAQALADALGVIADAVESVHLDELPDVWPMLTEHSQAVPTCSLDEWHTHLREYIAALEGLSERYVEAQISIVTSETTVLPNGVESNLPTCDWQPITWAEMQRRIRCSPTLKKGVAEKMIAGAADPDSDSRTDEGWHHVKLPAKRENGVGDFHGGLRARCWVDVKGSS
mgnify:CR=1 FL=1